LPTDDQILNEIRDILRTADLMTVTKKGIKQELERRFNVSLDAKRAYIGACESYLSNFQRLVTDHSQQLKQSFPASYNLSVGFPSVT
jgi:hypothetical protein